MTPDERRMVERRISGARSIINFYKKDIDFLLNEFGEKHSEETIVGHRKEIAKQEQLIRAWTVALNLNVEMA